jgi:hypothetical protein
VQRSASCLGKQPWSLSSALRCIAQALSDTWDYMMTINSIVARHPGHHQQREQCKLTSSSHMMAPYSPPLDHSLQVRADMSDLCPESEQPTESRGLLSPLETGDRVGGPAHTSTHSRVTRLGDLWRRSAPQNPPLSRVAVSQNNTRLSRPNTQLIPPSSSTLSTSPPLSTSQSLT